jgi:hypothetical protein
MILRIDARISSIVGSCCGFEAMGVSPAPRGIVSDRKTLGQIRKDEVNAG